MKMTQLFSQTLREVPSDAEIASHQLLLRAGFLRQLVAGIFTYLPLARRALHKIENLLFVVHLKQALEFLHDWQ